MKKVSKGFFKSDVLVVTAFPGALHSSAGGSVLSGVMAHKKKGVDIIQGVFPAVLVQYPGIPGKTHGSKTVILGNDQISGCNPVHQSVVHTVGTLVKYQGLCSGAAEHMGGITKDQAGNAVLSPEPKDDIHHRTAVGINENFRIHHLPGEYITALGKCKQDVRKSDASLRFFSE